MRPEVRIANDPCQRGSGSVLCKRFFLDKIKSCFPIEAFEIPVLMQVLDRTAHIVKSLPSGRGDAAR